MAAVESSAFYCTITRDGQALMMSSRGAEKQVLVWSPSQRWRPDSDYAHSVGPTDPGIAKEVCLVVPYVGLVELRMCSKILWQ